MNLSTASKYSSRDNATASLRKMGINKGDYDNFIVRRDGTYYCDTLGATSYAKKIKPAIVLTPKALAISDAKIITRKAVAKVVSAALTTMSNTAITPITVPSRPGTVSDMIRGLIRSGASNNQIWITMGPDGTKALKPNQSSYPSWYRSELRRRGEAV